MNMLSVQWKIGCVKDLTQVAVLWIKLEISIEKTCLGKRLPLHHQLETER